MIYISIKDFVKQVRQKGMHKYMNTISDKSFRNPKYQISLKELALCGKDDYWKFSQSSPNKGYTDEQRCVYENYNTSMRIVEAGDKEMMLSFVSASNLYKCVPFGDQITHLLFDINNSTFQSNNEFTCFQTRQYIWRD